MEFPTIGNLKQALIRNRIPPDLNTAFIEDPSEKNKDIFPKAPCQKKPISFHKSLIASKSFPNHGHSFQQKQNNDRLPMTFRSRIMDCIHSPSRNPNKSSTDLYKKYSGNNGTSFFRSFSVRNKRLKELQDIYNFCNEENTFTVKIRKNSRGLGLCISGGKDASKKDPFDQLIRISNLHPLQPAMECGKLTSGDVILQVNGISVVGMTKTEAEEIIRRAFTDVELILFRPSKFLIPSLPEFKKNWCSDSNSTCCSYKNAVLFADKNSNCEKSREVNVTLLKKDGCLGFTIARLENTKNSTGGIFIKALTREHAILNGRIKAGDRILQVNGIDISTFSHAEAIHCLRNAPDKVTLKICLSCNGTNACPKHSFSKVETFSVVIVKSPNESFGFCVWDTFDLNRNFQTHLLPCAAEVKVVYPGTIADKNGIKIGDRILEVNGESLLYKTAHEVIGILRKTCGIVRMVFCRLQ